MPHMYLRCGPLSKESGDERGREVAPHLRGHDRRLRRQRAGRGALPRREGGTRRQRLRQLQAAPRAIEKVVRTHKLLRREGAHAEAAYWHHNCLGRNTSAQNSQNNMGITAKR